MTNFEQTGHLTKKLEAGWNFDNDLAVVGFAFDVEGDWNVDFDGDLAVIEPVFDVNVNWKVDFDGDLATVKPVLDVEGNWNVVLDVEGNWHVVLIGPIDKSEICEVKMENCSIFDWIGGKKIKLKIVIP